MTDIEAKALALVNEIELERGATPYSKLNRHGGAEAIYRAIERHEAFKQEVSDVMMYIRALYPTLPRNFNRFIIPKPKPDPLVEVLAEVDTGNGWDDATDYARQIHKALAARGLEIREKGQ
jgi:hypothetical protein